MHAEANALLKERVRQLAETNEALESFAYSMSHDPRAPLRGIDGWCLAVLEDYGGALDETGRGYLARVRAETHRMGALIGDLLQLSRMGRAEMRWGAVDMSGLAAGVASHLK